MRRYWQQEPQDNLTGGNRFQKPHRERAISNTVGAGAHKESPM